MRNVYLIERVNIATIFRLSATTNRKWQADSDFEELGFIAEFYESLWIIKKMGINFLIKLELKTFLYKKIW